jgi:osmotically-inducible protein OsmY
MMQVTDAHLRRQVQDALDRRAVLDDEAIALTAKDGVVTLSGEVSAFELKHLAERTALGVSGVRAVANEILVREPDSGGRSDTAIARDVAQHLRWHAPVGHVMARVENGWVSLEGEVPLLFHRASAERGLRHVPGVRGVTNLIVVTNADPSESCRAAIEAALVERVHALATQIHVTVSGERVTLTGVVSTEEDLLEAEKVVRSASGVREIVNCLRTKGGEEARWQ